MRFPLDDTLLAESEAFGLRSACCHCMHGQTNDGHCSLGWPNVDQRRWPLDAPDSAGKRPAFAEFCREFELV